MFPSPGERFMHESRHRSPAIDRSHTVRTIPDSQARALDRRHSLDEQQRAFQSSYPRPTCFATAGPPDRRSGQPRTAAGSARVAGPLRAFRTTSCLPRTQMARTATSSGINPSPASAIPSTRGSSNSTRPEGRSEVRLRAEERGSDEGAREVRAQRREGERADRGEEDTGEQEDRADGQESKEQEQHSRHPLIGVGSRS